jgi:hypothetical protein
MVKIQQDNHHQEHFVSLEIFLLVDFVVVVDLQHVSDYLNVYHRVAMVMLPRRK